MYDEVKLSPSIWAQPDDVALHVRRQYQRALRRKIPCFVTGWLDDQASPSRFTIASFDAEGRPTADPVSPLWAPRIEARPESANCTMTFMSLDPGYDIGVMVLNRVPGHVPA